MICKYVRNTSNRATIFFGFYAGCSTGLHFFEKVQDLPTRGAGDVEHFTVNGSVYLAFANYHGDIYKHKAVSMIYKMNELTGKFNLYQTLQTRGALGLEYFSIGDKHFLAVANYYDGTRLLDSVVYQWNGQRFVAFQKIPTKGAQHFTFFKISGQNYLTVANQYDGSTHSTKSVIYKWSNGKFNKFQEIPTAGALGCIAFVINNDTFIAFANNYNSNQKYAVQSTVFKWSGGHTEHTTSPMLTSMVTHSSPLPIITMEVNATSTRIFTSGMATSLFCSNPFLLVEPSLGIPL